MSSSAKSALYLELSESILFLPRHFQRKGQTLDSAFDGYRLHKTLSSSSLDLILMSYRYAHLFERVVKKFTPKKVKPLEMLDLWLVGFSALLTRDQVPAFAIVSECVEISKSKFGAHTSAITNAFLRHIDREKAAILASLSQNPEQILPQWLKDRWKTSPHLKSVAQNFSLRPSSGVLGFDSNLEHTRKEWSSDMFSAQKFQAMDTGSFKFCQWVVSKLLSSDKNFVDTCAAPGGKAIFTAQHLKQKHPESRFVLCESKPARLGLIKENLKRWDLESSANTVFRQEWGVDPIPEPLQNFIWDFVLCDLPCSGSGTLLSRPDVLFRKWEQTISDLKVKQEQILKQVLSLKSSKFFISICSTDEEEISHLSKILGITPQFHSWDVTSPSEGLGEGIVGWLVVKD
jgi:16S rRNA (cytosine967-C5)-methyltransferase